MKRFVFISLFLCLLVSLTYAEGKSGMDKGFVVKSVTGNVKYEISEGKWKAVTVDTLLVIDSMINTGINSSLILETANKDVVTIKAMKKGIIKELIASGKSGFSGITLDGSLTCSDVNANDIQERTNIGTASTRASDATEDLEWVAEEDLQE